MLAQAYLFPPLSVGGTSRAHTCRDTSAPSSNRAYGSPAHGAPITVSHRHAGHPARSADRPSRHRVYPGSAKEGSQPRGNPLMGIPVSGKVKVRPVPSAEVLLSSAYKRYDAPLRLPARPGPISAAPYTSPLSVLAHPAGSPVVPSGVVPACHPCYPRRAPVTWQRCGSLGHRSSSPDNGVDALPVFTGLHLGSLHATACGVARPPP